MKRLMMLGFLGSCAFFGSSVVVTLSPRWTAPAEAQSPEPVRRPSAATDLLHIGDRFEAVAAKVSPAVVYVEAGEPAAATLQSGSKARPQEESGSGVLIRVEGQRGFLVLTNNHVVAQ